MTLVMAEACEDPIANIDNVKPWTGTAGQSGGGRTGAAWTTSSGQHPVYTVPSADRTDRMVVGVAINLSSTGTVTGRIVEFRSSTAAGSVGVEPVLVSGTSYKLRLVRISDGTNLAETAEAVVHAGTWYYLELKVHVHATAGTAELRTNEVTRLSVTGVDTTPASGGTQIAQVAFTTSSAVTSAIDDIYVVNDAGATNNDFLGDVTVHRLFPTAAGDSAQFVPEPITAANWETVDDFSTTDYNEAALAGLTDLYNFADLPGSVSGRQVFGLLSWGLLHSTILPRGGALLSKLSGTEAESATIALTGTAAGYVHRQETKPGGGTWTTADVDAAQHGVRVKS